MRIIYGLSGQGFGHSARSKETIAHLIAGGHEVRIFTYGQSLFLLAKEFGEDRIFEIPGFILSYKKNKVVYWKTIWENAKKLSHQARYWAKISHAFDGFNPDVVITDFEPLVCILAKTKRRPLISIDNQHQLTNTSIKISDKYQKDFVTAKLIIKSMVWGASDYLVTSFFKTPVTKKNTYLFPAVIRKEILELTPEVKDYILVYQGSDFEHILPILKKSNEKMVVFGPHKESQQGNIIYKSFAVEEWLKYLAGAKAVIGTAGLSLLCECIYLKKPYLAIPISRQVEQIINAQYIAKLSYGLATDRLTTADLDNFVGNLEKYRANLASAEGVGNDQLFAKLDEIIGNLANK